VETRSPAAVTALLQAWSRGDVAARDQLFPLVYAELRQRAARYLRRERPAHTLQPTALVHEAYIRLSGRNEGWSDRAQFFAVASQIMRRVLVDHARARRAAKRSGRRMQITLTEEAAAPDTREVDLLGLDDGEGRRFEPGVPLQVSRPGLEATGSSHLPPFEMPPGRYFAAAFLLGSSDGFTYVMPHGPTPCSWMMVWPFAIP
jgi:RNA polymerase sigma factor (TIGR02999 family)